MIENLSLYRYFYEVAEAGSISAAAKRLYVTQPAVSSMITQLEDRLGVNLFFRTTRGIKLTPEGEMLLEFIRRAFSFIEAGEAKMAEISQLEGGVLRIGASDMTLRFYLLDHIESFRVEHPKVHLTVTNAPTPLTLTALKGGEIDMCVVSEPFEKDDTIEYVPVREIRDIFATSPKFRFDKKVSFEELSKYPLIMLEKNTSTRRFCEQHFINCGVDEKLMQPEIELATSDLVMEFARRGIGIACIVEDFALPYIKSGELSEVELLSPFPKRKFFLAYLKNIPLTAAAKNFVSQIKGGKV